MYIYIWKFHVKDGLEKDFEMAYGAQGKWEQLFRKNSEYIKTELLHDLQHHNQYLTIDYWTSKEACESFRSINRSEFNAIDEECEGLTENEEYIGEYLMGGLQNT